jgi:HSP20 family protein
MAGLIPYGRKKGLAKNDPFDMGLWDRDFLRSFFGDTSVSGFRVDAKDKGDHYEIDAELPGLERNEIDVSLNDGYLTISANHNEEKKTESDDYVLNERRMGSVSRTFAVGDIKEDKVSAEYKDGILKVILPKTSGDKKETKKIDIK